MRRRSTRNWLTGAFLGIAACAGSGILHAQASPSQPQPPTRCGGTRLETQPGATLSELLAAYASSQCPLNALMWETYTANPHAFYGSVHHLRADSVLNVPLFDAPEAAQREEAARQMAAQREIYARYRSLVAQGVSRQRARRLSTGADDVRAGAPQRGTGPLRSGAMAAQGPDSAGLKLEPLAPAGTDPAGSSREQTVMRELALREAEARIRILEQQIGDLKGLLAERDQLLAAQQGKAGAPKPGGVEAGGVEADRPPGPAQALPAGGGDSAAQGARRERPAVLQSAEGMILAVLLLLALGTGMVLLWQMRRSASPGPVTPEPEWPAALRAARDAINLAAGRDAELQRQSELEKAVGGRFPLPRLDFVQGLGGTTNAPEPASIPGPGQATATGAAHASALSRQPPLGSPSLPEAPATQSSHAGPQSSPAGPQSSPAGLESSPAGPQSAGTVR